MLSFTRCLTSSNLYPTSCLLINDLRMCVLFFFCSTTVWFIKITKNTIQMTALFIIKAPSKAQHIFCMINFFFITSFVFRILEFCFETEKKIYSLLSFTGKVGFTTYFYFGILCWALLPMLVSDLFIQNFLTLLFVRFELYFLNGFTRFFIWFRIFFRFALITLDTYNVGNKYIWHKYE